MDLSCSGGTQEWYLRLTGADPNQPASYISIGSNPPSCPGTGKICAIFAKSDGNGYPIITEEIQDQMVNALSTGVDQPYVLLRSAN